MARYDPPQSAPVNVNTVADNQIVAGQSGFKTRVLGYRLVATGTNTVTWKSGTTVKEGPMSVAANTGISTALGDPDRSYLFECAAGEALNLTLTAAAQVGGGVTYIRVRA